MTMHAPVVRPAASARISSVAADDVAMLARIDRYVAAHPDATPFHRTGWNLAVAAACRQVPHWLVSRAGDGAIDGVLPLTEIHSPIFGRALVSVGFATDGGILAGTADTVGQLADAACGLADRLSCPTLELRGGALPVGWDIDDRTYLAFTHTLAADDEAELLSITRRQRAEIRRSLGFPLEVTSGSDARAARDHFRIYAESVHKLGTPVFPRALFAAMLDRMGDDADIVTVHHAGQPVASVLSLYWRGTVYPFWGGGTQAARALRANDRLYYALLCHARRRGCTRADFGRSKVGTGAAAFKKNWGFASRPLAYAIRTAPGAARRDANPLSPANRLKVAAWRRLPLSMATRFGPMLSRGLG